MSEPSLSVVSGEEITHPVADRDSENAPEKIKAMIGGLRKKAARIKEIAQAERAIHTDAYAQEG